MLYRVSQDNVDEANISFYCLQGIKTTSIKMSVLDEPHPHPVLERLGRLFMKLTTSEGRENAMNLAPRPTDVIVVTPEKCGTTWMQQIMHQLRSDGDMTFEDIDDVVPWIVLAHDLGQDLEAEHKYQPRCFKSHDWYQRCPKGAKYIVIYREPCAAFSSGYNFRIGTSLQRDEITLDEFVRGFYLKPDKLRTSYFQHLVSWWPKRNDPNVLMLTFEDMLEDLESAVRAVASFMGIDDEASITNAVKTSRFEFMKEHQEKFSSNRIARYRSKAMGFLDDVRYRRVITGSATKGREAMKGSTRQAVQDMWNKTVTKEIGYVIIMSLKRL